MKFITPCFVRVEDAEKRKELVEWLKKIGYKSTQISEEDKIIAASDSGYFCTLSEPPHLLAFPNDCNTTIDLFKALTAMNDENDSEQLFYSSQGLLFFNPAGAVVHDALKPCRKATKEEIIGHFKI